MTVERELLAWAKRALRGLDESRCFVGVMDDKPMDAARAEFVLQIGYAVLHDKTIVIPVPIGVEVPAKLEAVADAIVRYNPHDLSTLHAGLTMTLTEMGLNPQ